MSTIIAGRFEEQAQADAAIAALTQSGFASEKIAKFYVTSPGQHALHGTAHDPEASAGAHHAGSGAAKGIATGSGIGAVIGLTTTQLLGPAGPIAGAAIGAYVGSLAGAMEGMEDPKPGMPGDPNAGLDVDEVEPRKSGVLIGVSVNSDAEQASAVEVLRAQRAHDIEHAEGTIANGDWPDFDPLSPPALVDRQMAGAPVLGG
ncbi:MAG: hypothetical protein ABI854_04115 [Betaproteobacteria bacterium]